MNPPHTHTVSHPPYSRVLGPSDFFLFPWMKKALRGKRFAHVEEVKQKTAKALKGIKINESNTFLRWKNVSIGVLHQMESTLKVTEV